MNRIPRFLVFVALLLASAACSQKAADGLPIGLHIVGQPLGEETMLRAAYAYEQSTGFHHRRSHAIIEANGRRAAVSRA